MSFNGVVMTKGEQISVGEFTRVVKSIDNRLGRIDKNQAEALSYSMQNEQRITENEYKIQNTSDKQRVTDEKIDGYEKVFVKAAIAIVLTFGGTGASIYALIANQSTSTPAKATQIAKQ